MNVRTEVEEILGQKIVDAAPLSGGCIGQVYEMSLADGERVVIKADDGANPRLDVEGYMLAYLATHSELPVPDLLHSTPRLLIMAYVPGRSRFSPRAQVHAAELLAALHGVSAAAYGLERDTLIGGLHQPNSWTENWLQFFRDQRLLYMGQQGLEAGRLPGRVFNRLQKFCGRLETWLAEPERPSLLHGDVWTTNVLAQGDRITGFVDPAIYYGHPEIELAFTTLFGTFNRNFFDRYREIRPIPPGFFSERRDIYNLYPLLVHVRLFGGSYVHSIDSILRRFGF